MQLCVVGWGSLMQTFVSTLMIQMWAHKHILCFLRARSIPPSDKTRVTWEECAFLSWGGRGDGRLERSVFPLPRIRGLSSAVQAFIRDPGLWDESHRFSHTLSTEMVMVQSFPRNGQCLNHWSQTQFLEGHSSAQFSSNPNQTHLIQLIKLLMITRNVQAGVIWSWLKLNCAELRPSRNWVWDQWFKLTVSFENSQSNLIQWVCDISWLWSQVVVYINRISFAHQGWTCLIKIQSNL